MVTEQEQNDRVDDVMLHGALREILEHETPPDLRRVVMARATQGSQSSAPRSLAALLLVALGLATVVGVSVWSRLEDRVGAQDPKELEFQGPEDLRKQLGSFSGALLVARSRQSGARLDRRPEYVHTLEKAWVASLAREDRGPVPSVADAALRADLQLQAKAGVAVVGVYQGPEQWFLKAHKWQDAWPLSNDFGNRLAKQIDAMSEREVAPRRKIPVASLADLLAAIGNDRQIEWTGSEPLMLPRSGDGYAEFTFDDERVRIVHGVLEFTGLRNCELRGRKGAPMRLLARNPAEVLRMVDCRNVWMQDVVMGHAENVGPFCTGAVLVANRCADLHLRDCELFGCGSQALVFDGVEDFTCDRCDLHTCTVNAMSLKKTKGARFSACQIRDCTVWGQAALIFRDCFDVRFIDCAIVGMSSAGRRDAKPLFLVEGKEAIAVRGGRIVGNQVSTVSSFDAAVLRTGVEESDNGPDVKVESGR